MSKRQERILDFVECLDKLSDREFEDLLLVIYDDGARPESVSRVKLASSLVDQIELFATFEQVISRKWKPIHKCIQEIEKKNGRPALPKQEDLAGFWAQNADDYLPLNPDELVSNTVRSLSGGVRVGIVCENRKPIGFVSISDLVRLNETGELGSGKQLGSKTIREVMSRSIISVEDNTHMKNVQKLLVEKHINQVVVIDINGIFLGLVSLQEVAKWADL